MSALVSSRKVVDNVGVEALKSSVPVTAPVTLILGLLVMPDHATALAVAALPVISLICTFAVKGCPLTVIVLFTLPLSAVLSPLILDILIAALSEISSLTMEPAAIAAVILFAPLPRVTEPVTSPDKAMEVGLPVTPVQATLFAVIALFFQTFFAASYTRPCPAVGVVIVTSLRSLAPIVISPLSALPAIVTF